MNGRQLTPVDRLLAGLGNALSTVAARDTRPARPNPAADIEDAPLSDSERRHAAGLMRVNHAGEVAAQALYQGHAAIARDPEIAAHLKTAADEERDHLKWCEQRLEELGAAPSKLGPFWYTGAFAIGATSGIFGDRWSLGFVEETERQVAAHLADHNERLPAADGRSRAIVEQMRQEEMIHGENARQRGARDLPLPVRRLMEVCAGIMKKTAYRL